jgi:hypothetical protein
MNAKTELFELHKQVLVDIKCAVVILNERFVNGGKTRQTLLKVGHTTEELYSFFNELDFDYDDGYGGQELFGTIWFVDGTYAARSEYDGSEWWEHHKCPEIPDSLK